MPPDRQYPPFFKVIPGTTRSKSHSFFRVDAYVSHLHTHYLHSPKAHDLPALLELGYNGTGIVTVICRFRVKTGDTDGFFTVSFTLPDTRVPFSHVPTRPAATEMYAHICLRNALEKPTFLNMIILCESRWDILKSWALSGGVSGAIDSHSVRE